MAKGEESTSMTQQSKKKRNDDESLPTDVGQKPIQLQRRRVWRACESCRRKKIKCDGYRAALSRHYVQELEARLLHMESLFSQIAPVLEHIGPSINGGAPGSSNGVSAVAPDSSIPAAPAIPPTVPKEITSEPSTPIKTEDDVSESFGQLALDEYGHLRWIGGSSTMSLIQSFRALTSSPLHRISPMEEDPHAPGPSVNKIYFPASVFFGKVKALPGPEEVEYPERDLADKLVEAYFSRLHFLMPVLDKPTFLRQYNNIMDNMKDLALVRSEAAFLGVLFAVFACAAHLVQDSRLTTGERNDDGGMGMVYYERALILQYISHANTQIAHVQCFVLMSSFLCSINCLPQAWILLGQAVRIGQDLGLHRSPRRLLITPIEKETRRKIWWGVYTLDRMLALALGRPLGINDSDCDVEQPVEVDDDHLSEYFTGATMTQQQSSLTAGAVALNHLYEIGGRVLRQVYALDICRDHLEPEKKAELQRTVESLDNELTKWCEDLPAVFKSQSETDEQVSMGAVLCSHYYSILTTLHRNLLPVRRDQPQPVTAKSTIKAVSSARSCIRLAPSMKHVVPPSHHLAFFIQHLFSSAVILLLYAMHASESRAAAAAMEEAKSALVALESWEGQWPGAKKCKELLLDLTNTASQAIAEGSKQPPPAPGLPSAPASASAPAPNPAPSQRRRSVTIATASSTVPGRVVKGRSSRRNQSRDPSVSSSRRMAAVSPYRVDSAERARSTSRRRRDDESLDRQGRPYYQTFAGSTSGAGVPSPHSSPSSANLPSPSMSVIEHSQEGSPGTSNTPPYKYATSPVTATQQPSPPRFEYEYGLQSSPLVHSNPNPWNGSEEQRPSGLDLYAAGSSEVALYPNTYGLPSSLDAYPGYDGSDMTMAGLSITPPSSSFAATGLPFRGLDYIRNYNTGAFGFDPDLPFNLGDHTLDLTNHPS
ncbi:putative fungal specific transcription factor [Lyophyllum shimeji]|uniref:Fungal specific transcription factor n=1 Tax=Lyophyllum shimeji TaxID=47721 RepID=A0A9P3UHB2_LYOSH|nr:putative fungal specific transcription factor [Lyophyllum shimeji]